ncbi:MAG: hypothetical protein ACKOF9_08095 [Burkholderiales bacterium]
MFESTLPQGEPELMRASSYIRYLDEMDGSPWAANGLVLGTRLSGLSPSLQADLLRYEDKRWVGDSLDVLEVMAASVRHAKGVTIHCQSKDRAVPLTVFPQQHSVHCPLSLNGLDADALAKLTVLHVEPAVLQPPSEDPLVWSLEQSYHYSLAPWLWALAWYGARCELLPEIAGLAAYRVGPSTGWERFPMPEHIQAAVNRMRGNSVNLRELMLWPGLSRELAIRLLNALYLQGGLIVSRTHPGAANESWFGGLGRG